MHEGDVGSALYSWDTCKGNSRIQVSHDANPLEKSRIRYKIKIAGIRFEVTPQEIIDYKERNFTGTAPELIDEYCEKRYEDEIIRNEFKRYFKQNSEHYTYDSAKKRYRKYELGLTIYIQLEELLQKYKRKDPLIDELIAAVVRECINEKVSSRKEDIKNGFVQYLEQSTEDFEYDSTKQMYCTRNKEFKVWLSLENLLDRYIDGKVNSIYGDMFEMVVCGYINDEIAKKKNDQY